MRDEERASDVGGPAAVGGFDRRVLVEAALIFTVALVARSLSVSDALTFDEFYHVLAARSFLDTGTLAIATGVPYERARLFTYAVAGSMRLFGDSLVAARLPAIVFGSLWVVLIFGWVRRIAGPVAAWIAALLLCFDPHAIGLSQIARMYSMHSLAFWVGVVILFEVVTSRQSSRGHLLALIGGAAAFFLAFHLQMITVIGVASLAAWPILRILVKRVVESRRNRVKLALAVLAGLVLGAALSTTHIGSELVYRYQAVNPRQRLMNLNARYYFWWITSSYPALVTLSPFALLIAVRRNRSMALYCASFLVFAFVLHSAAASKQVRYLHYALPAFFIIWGLAAAEVAPMARGLVSDAASALSRAVRIMPKRLARAGFWFAAIGFALATSPSVPQAVRLIVPGLHRPIYGNNFWPHTVARLQPYLAADRLVVSTAIPQTLYFLNRGDVEVGLNFKRQPEAGDFSLDWRLGTPVITTLASLVDIVRCNDAGLLTVHEPYWRASWGMSEAMADFAERELTPVRIGPAAGASGFRAFVWDGDGSAESDPTCALFRPPFDLAVEAE